MTHYGRVAQISQHTLVARCWPDEDRCACDHAMGHVLVEKNGPHLSDTGVLMVVATDLGSDLACGTGPGHDTHPGVGNIGGLVPHAFNIRLNI